MMMKMMMTMMMTMTMITMTMTIIFNDDEYDADDDDTDIQWWWYRFYDVYKTIVVFIHNQSSVEEHWMQWSTMWRMQLFGLWVPSILHPHISIWHTHTHNCLQWQDNFIIVVLDGIFLVLRCVLRCQRVRLRNWLRNLSYLINCKLELDAHLVNR